MNDPAKPKSDTADQILDIAEMLIQTRGYSAFSYQDIADAIGIRKASIHYHFPSKADLALAVVERYAARFSESLGALDQATQMSAMEKFDHYTGPFLEFAVTPDRICLCGALAGEILALPEATRQRVGQFFEFHQAWLAGLLKLGLDRGEFQFPHPPEAMSRMVFGALQGALIVKRTTGDSAQLHDVIAVLKRHLTGS